MTVEDKLDAFGDEESASGEKALSGEEVFRGLYRLFPMADPHIYFKNGRWQVELMLIDTELLEVHRREASAPEPPPLEEVILPADMPKERPVPTYPARIPLSGAVPKPLAATRATAAIQPMPVRVTPFPSGKVPSPAGSTARAMRTPGPAPARGATSYELETIANFITTWELEASKAKLCLARLGAARRRWVLENYDGILPLEDFIAESDASNAWADAVQPMPAAKPLAKQPTSKPPASLLRPATIKRAFTPSPSEYALSKRPRIGGSAYTPARPLGYSSSADYGAPPTNSRWPTYRPTSPQVMQRAGMVSAAKPAAYRPAAPARPSAYGRSYEAQPGSMIRNLLR